VTHVQLCSVVSVLGDGGGPVGSVVVLIQRALFVELYAPGRVRCVDMRCPRYRRARRCVLRFMSRHSPSNHDDSGRFQTTTNFAGDMLGELRSQNVIVAGEQIGDIGRLVSDKWRLSQIACKPVRVQGQPLTADLSRAGVRV